MRRHGMSQRARRERALKPVDLGAQVLVSGAKVEAWAYRYCRHVEIYVELHSPRGVYLGTAWFRCPVRAGR